ncbi:DUF1015 domain-containing protein [Empedobacter sedimenti]|uniref:DUF1015 domain-containing protein n=1 Tax=Empedobacter sedimenti TaxID=3042610 RepID=UPI0024A6E27A|nr:DUF1015 domain-containing protein [Empedobacter sedimenti]
MPQFKPFKGIRPTEETSQEFVTLAVNQYSKEEVDYYINTRENSFLHIILPTWDDSIDDPKEKFRKVRKNLEEFIEKKILVQDKSSFYIYQVIQPNGRQTKGLLGLVNIDDYRNNKIKKHEETLERRVELFAEYLKESHFHAEPVLLTYKPAQRVDLLIDTEMKRKPILKIDETNGTQHLLWRVDNRLNLKQLKDSIEKLDDLYIADGHHRMESSERYTKFATKNSDEEVYGDEAFNYTLALLVSNEELIINDYNRLIKDLNGLSSEEFIARLEEYFEIIPKNDELTVPTKKHHLVMYLDNKFYSLYVKNNLLNTEGLSELDTYIFEETVLKSILNIQDTKKDIRVHYECGTRDKEGVEALKNKVDHHDYIAAFAFYPVDVKDLQLIADLGLKMPPKSTYIEPKPLSGFAVFDLKE